MFKWKYVLKKCWILIISYVCYFLDLIQKSQLILNQKENVFMKDFK